MYHSSQSTSRACERSGPKIAWSGAQREEGVAENYGAGVERGAGGRGAGSGLNWPLTARSNLTFH